ncbi:hypothetical protein F7Q99_36670 [Streptomyces kaniharaensis]|uniref:Uncharacterized protein n=1 Tax=Streptomyces kaniharaensis TaxID=212423 RepID=A0A6N7L2Z5_9ACTN|nr:hypothetical protein [Streptomyces kaniharaensis]MQS17575.1 hypothetical protein [Streptomyces kaniharaensis]
MGRRISAAKAYLGFGSSSSSGGSTSDSATRRRGWWSSDPAADLANHRTAQVNVPAATYSAGQRVFTPDPYVGGGDHFTRNFGGPFTPSGDGGAQ